MKACSDIKLAYAIGKIVTMFKGCAPAGFGIGEKAKDISGKDLITEVVGKSGFYRGQNVVNAPSTGWWRFIVSAGASQTTVIANSNDCTDIRMGTFLDDASSIDWTMIATANYVQETCQGKLTFDSTPTKDSTNPVTSGGVYTSLSKKQNTLTFDTIPTKDSTNPVTSGGVKAALDSLQIVGDYAPDGFGLGTNAVDISNKDLITEVAGKSGFYRGSKVTNAPSTGWWQFFVSGGLSQTTVIAQSNDSAEMCVANFAHSSTSINWVYYGHSYGTDDLTAGTSSLTTGKVHFVYE